MNVTVTTAAAGTCGACSSLLAAGQRYCIACGERRGELPFRPPERSQPPPVALARRRSFGAVGVVVLASGVLIGAAVGPAITPSSLASTAGQLIVVAGGGSVPAESVAQLGSGAAPSGSLSAPTGDVAKPPAVVIDRGGGGGAAPQQPVPAPSPPTASTAPAKPTAPPAAPPPTAPVEDPTVSGTVVHLSHDGHGYAVATKDGQLLAFHAANAPTELGDKLKVTLRALQNGTFQERSTKSLGHADTASFHGTVTFADAQAGVYTVSARGVSLLVHLPAPPLDPTLPLPQVPPVGLLTTVDVTFMTQLEEVKRVDGDPAVGEVDIEAIVRGPSPDPTQLVVSADDAGESPSTLALHVPPEVDVSALKPGTVISALVKREADGSLTLVSAGDDSNRQAADGKPSAAASRNSSRRASWPVLPAELRPR